MIRIIYEEMRNFDNITYLEMTAVAEVKSSWIQKRYLIAFLAFFGYVNMYCLRTNLSMAMVEMTSNRTIEFENGTKADIVEFKWNSQKKSLALSSFSFGYIFTVLGGMTATKYGGVTVFGAGVGLTGLITLFTPMLLHFDFKLFLLFRALEGWCEAAAFASMPEIWSKWSPPAERSRLVSYSFTGVYFGLTVSYPIAGFVAKAWGWPAIFYVTGGAALVWWMIWLFFVYNEPSQDKSLSPAELKYLMENIKNEKKDKIVYPWKRMLTSVPLWTLCVVEFVFSLGYTVVILYLPLYIKDINNIDINKIGMVSALPHLFAVISHPIAGYLGDVLKNRKILTGTRIHKLYICVGFAVGAALLNLVAFWRNFVGIVMGLALYRLFTSFSDVAFHVNVIDLSPKYASVLFGITTTFFTLGAVASPFFIGSVVKTHSQFEWNVCFVSFSFIYIVGAVLYAFFASGETQPWNEDPPKDTQKKSTLNNE
ncbi:vesicular glutamate transporter 3-like [Planococcus citri]|uniref:vesicular glutamate transporter 3-like n=1 Tax=Planococcus citri TaxID=170843 RepID=UPI0031F8CF72